MPLVEMIASGRVQGIGFRYFVRQCALAHGVYGYVKNLYDGTVKIVALADSDTLVAFATDIKTLHRIARIDRLSITELSTNTEYEDFSIV